MFIRIDKLQVELPMPGDPDPDAAAAVQELLGGRFGEMSTVMNYMYQSFNFRGRNKVKPYYDLIADIATEELSHIELVAAVINGMLTGAADSDDPTETALKSNTGKGNPHHFINTGLGATVTNSLGQGWNGEYVFNSGDIVLDLLHNVFLESGARMAKIRVYEMTDHPIARQMLGYLFTRGGCMRWPTPRRSRSSPAQTCRRCCRFRRSLTRSSRRPSRTSRRECTPSSTASARRTSRISPRSGGASTR